MPFLGNWVRQTRDELGLNQTEFALKVGVSYAAIQKWEQGKSKPRLKWRRRIEQLRREARGGTGLTVPADLTIEISRIARNKNVDEATVLRQIIRAGLQQFAPSAEAGTGPAINPDESTAELRRRRLALQEARSGKSRQPSRRQKPA